MRCSIVCLGLAFILTMGSVAQATTFRFDTDPFAGSTALTTPGRQVVGGETFINFSIGTDVFSFDPAVFGVGNTVQFANDLAANLPTSGVNVIVLRTFDDDNNGGTVFGAGNAANLIASRITTPGAGFFIYFNSALDLARLVYSTDLNDNTADLKILARMTNLTGQAGRDALASFTAANFEITTTDVAAVPEPATLSMMGVGLALAYRRSRRA